MANNLYKEAKFIGFVEESERLVIDELIDNNWQTDLFGIPPLSALSPSRNYLLTLGSGIYPSLATTSPQGVDYFAGLDIFRSDFESNNLLEPLINIDHYVISSTDQKYNRFAIFKIPNVSYHWPKLSDPIIQELPRSWRYTVEDLLRGKPRSTI
jgi:hypothetical protein